MLRTFLFSVSILLSSLVLPQQVYAAPILSQEIIDLDGNVLGNFAIDLRNVDGSGVITDWLVFNLTDFSPISIDSFFAEIDPTNLTSGLSLLFFDINDLSLQFLLQGFFEIDSGWFEVRDFNSGELISATGFTLSNAQLVSEPGTLLFLIASAFGLMLRRR
ncbi:hypothetical protein [Rheinheimera maricola]|uniref:PEP-CTERM sorting domain-containing protein n=1 Tax=Rheinheimera maricola TaxID=2793282 RepID=A0ABS7X9J3_9GAMM|nr:hypothetical protein [Rheinheimera maricola]MBZ9611472.1 hypothetical protein [Rheinheimera maricola]